ncbi:serine hydrolase [Mesorhizobium silamurunense]|uniref:serine hydrolase n=1 Tax=Mesorhizobium silamurunense TaxID=499528 RepID=UPI0028A99EF9|nr:serine hydrolase [Mesorhizobium silamurunense]
MCDYLCTICKAVPHGESVEYMTANTDALAWAMGRVTGRSFEQLLHERLWPPLGCEEAWRWPAPACRRPLATWRASAS